MWTETILTAGGDFGKTAHQMPVWKIMVAAAKILVDSITRRKSFTTGYG
jgi:hypothetical protein